MDEHEPGEPLRLDMAAAIAGDYRAVGSVGGRCIHTDDNDTGADSCNHDWQGIFIMAGGDSAPLGQRDGFEIYDVGATVAGLLELPHAEGRLGTDRSR